MQEFNDTIRIIHYADVDVKKVPVPITIQLNYSMYDGEINDGTVSIFINFSYLGCYPQRVDLSEKIEDEVTTTICRILERYFESKEEFHKLKIIPTHQTIL